MSTFSTNLTNSSNISNVVTAPVGSFYEKLASAITHKYRAYKTEAALSALSDVELEDIGLLRSDIQTIAHRVNF